VAGEPGGVVAAVSNHSADDAEGTELDYFHGVVSDAEVPGASESLDIEPGTWAVFESSGEFPLAVQHLWRDVYTQWFPSNPYRSRPGPSLSRTRVSEDGTHADAEVWIPVERVGG
jgi:AraC family transcriptional regulator